MSVLDRVPTYSTKVDWNGDGTFNTAEDDLSARRLSDSGISIQTGRDQVRSLAPPMIPSAEFAIDNSDRLYSPEWPGSPVYQIQRPRRPVEIAAKWGVRSLYRKHVTYRDHKPYRGIGNWKLFTGVLADLPHNPTLGEWSMSLSALGTLSKLRGRKVSCPLMVGPRTDQALAALLDAAGWPAGKRLVSVGDTTLTYWWATEADAYSAAVQLLASEGAGSLMVEDGDGNFVFQNRNYRAANPRSLTSQGTFSDHIGGLTYERLTYNPSWANIVNRCTFPVNRRVAGSSQVVWTYGSAITLGAGASIAIKAQPNGPFQNAIIPVSGVDYVVTSGSVAGVGLVPTAGGQASISILAGAGGAGISGLQLRAEPLTVTNQTVIENAVTAAVTTSLSDYDERTYEVPGWPETDPNQAQAIVDSIVGRYASKRPIVQVQIANPDGAHMEKILRLRHSDRITLVNQHLGLNTDVYIEAVQHQISAGGRIHRALLGCEVVAETSGSLWDQGLWDSALWGA